VIGSLVDFMMGCDAPGAVINRMASPDSKIVCLTITKGGYKELARWIESEVCFPNAMVDRIGPVIVRWV
jgi:mannitol 2-dehydrogenase